jgi:hypothetical protein
MGMKCCENRGQFLPFLHLFKEVIVLKLAFDDSESPTKLELQLFERAKWLMVKITCFSKLDAPRERYFCT